MASMKGGHFLTVRVSSPIDWLNAFCGTDLYQSGRPCTAGIGRGSSFSSSTGHRNVSVASTAWSILAYPLSAHADPKSGQFYLDPWGSNRGRRVMAGALGAWRPPASSRQLAPVTLYREDQPLPRFAGSYLKV